MASKRETPLRRKLIAFDPETWMALDLLAQDRMASVQELADEAFADLLQKHHRPTSLKAALRESDRVASSSAETPPPRAAPARKRGARRR